MFATQYSQASGAGAGAAGATVSTQTAAQRATAYAPAERSAKIRNIERMVASGKLGPRSAAAAQRALTRLHVANYAA
jgi:hypothetical protein